jgi:hypothetical protein
VGGKDRGLVLAAAFETSPNLDAKHRSAANRFRAHVVAMHMLALEQAFCHTSILVR